MGEEYSMIPPHLACYLRAQAANPQYTLVAGPAPQHTVCSAEGEYPCLHRCNRRLVQCADVEVLLTTLR